MNEIWMEIVSLNEPSWLISNFGKLKNINTGSVTYGSETKKGYMRKFFNDSGKSKMVHVLVAESFLDNPEGKLEVNHIDGNRSNNNINNLEWVTRSENVLHSFKHGLKTNNLDKNPNAKLNKMQMKKIQEMSLSGVRKSCIAKVYKLCVQSVYQIEKKVII